MAWEGIWFIGDQDWNLEKSYFTILPTILFRFIFNLSRFRAPHLHLYRRTSVRKYLGQTPFVNSLQSAKKATPRTVSSILPRVFSSVREFQVPCRIRGERNVRKKHAIFVRPYECRRTKLHEIASSWCTLLERERKNALASRRDHEKAHRVGRTEANFRPRFIRRRMDDARFPEVGGTLDFRRERWLSAADGGGGGGRVAAPWKMPPREGYLPMRCVLRQRHFFHCPGSARYTRRFYKSAVWNCIRKLNYVRKYSQIWGD